LLYRITLTAWLKTKAFYQRIRRRSWPKARKTAKWKLPKHPPANICLNNCQKSPSKPKDQSEGQAKGKGKVKAQVEQALPTELQNSKERKDSHGQCVQYGKNSDGIQKQGGGKIEPIFPKEIDLVKLLRELKLQVQNLENSTGHNAALFQEQLEKSDKARLELKENIQSSINDISLKNELPSQSTPILDRNVLNDLHHTISSNEVETACNFKDIPKLEEWPTFNGEGEYNHMEF
ncbi:hypothetical protein O181_131363, partial [Austropuccinia psidii MF-1]|nr:hypothetical protein [Austropuccinia psidii MF-1]